MSTTELLDLVPKPENDDGRPIAEPAAAKEESTREVSLPEDNSLPGELSPDRRADLHASAITDAAIIEAGIRDGRNGWTLPWSDGVDSFDLLVYDRDKRPKDGRKNAWPKGQTSTVNVLRDPGPDRKGWLVVEGVRQSVAALSNAPEGWAVAGINGCDGIHEGIADRLPALFKGENICLTFDADWRDPSSRVHKAATVRVPRLLYGAGAVAVFLVDNGGEGTDGLDDVLANRPEHDRAGWLRHLMSKGRTRIEPLDKRTQAILDAALDATDLDHLPEPEPLLPGYLNRAEYVLLAGRFGTYKSFVALAWAYAVATGRSWDGQDPAEARPVVYVAAEGITGYRRRLRALERRYGVKVPQGMLTVIHRPVHLTNPDEVQGLRLIMERTGARLVVLDTWHRMTPGVEENSATETGGPLDRLLALRDDYGATVLLVHHTGHAQRHARGSSALEDDADASWMIKLGNGAEDEEDRSPANPRTLVQRKSKDGELAEPARLRLQVDDAGQATVDLDPFELAPPAPTGKPGRRARVDHQAAVRELVQALDHAGKPADMSTRQVEDWEAQRRPGQSAPRAVIREAAAARRGRAAETAEALAKSKHTDDALVRMAQELDGEVRS